MRNSPDLSLRIMAVHPVRTGTSLARGAGTRREGDARRCGLWERREAGARAASSGPRLQVATVDPGPVELGSRRRGRTCTAAPTAASTPGETPMRKWLRENRDLLTRLLACCLFLSAVADCNPVPSGSMRPTIQEGDVILVD